MPKVAYSEEERKNIRNSLIEKVKTKLQKFIKKFK